MAKSAVASAIDGIVARTLVPTLKVEGFRKKGRHWSAVEGDVHRAVTVQASQANWGGGGRFTIEVGVSFGSLGHQPPWLGAFGAAVGHRLSWLGKDPHDVWFELVVDDPASIERAGDAVDMAWRDLGLPFVQATSSPERLCEHLVATGNTTTALLALLRVGIPLGDHALQLRLLRTARRDAATRTRWRSMEADPHPLEGGLSPWAEIIVLGERLGDKLQPDEETAALAVLRDAEAGMLSTRYHGSNHEEAAQIVARALRIAPPRFAAMG